MFFLDHIVNEKPFLDEKHCLNTVKSVATIKKLAAMSSFVVWTTNCCVLIKQITCFITYVEGSKVPNSSNGHVLEERRK